MNLIDVLIEVHLALDAAEVPHAFGGALALGWCTEQARATIDVDVNVLLPVAEVDRLLAALPQGVVGDAEAMAQLRRDGQARFRNGPVAVDLFLDTTEFHQQLGGRVRRHELFGHVLPFLACDDLCVFKAFFNRRKDWADIEAMLRFGSVDVDYVVGVLEAHLGGDDPRIGELRAVEHEVRAGLGGG